jgi:hypothetical protein
VRLPEPIERLLNPGEPWMGVPRPGSFRSVWRAQVTPGMPASVVELHYDGIPPWWAGPYGQDVPK